MRKSEYEYIEDLQCILAGYKERMTSGQSSMANKADLIFGNMEQILAFHKEVLLHQVESSSAASDSPSRVADIFIENSEEMLKLYCR